MADLSVQRPADHAGVRIPPPLFYLGIFAVGWLVQRFFPLPSLPAPVSWVGGASFVAAGILLSIWSIGLFRRAQTSLVPIKPSTALVVAGPYRLTRNPMYLGLLLVYVGMALWMNVLWGLILLPVLVAVVQRLVIQPEERYLERKFGADYLHYKTRVRRWL